MRVVTFELQFNICECASPIVPFECATAVTAVQDHRSQCSVNMYTVNGSVIWILCLVFWLAGKNSPPQGGGKFSAAAHVGFLCPMKITVFRVVKPRSPVERYIYICRRFGGTFWLHLQDRPTLPTLTLNLNLYLIMVAK